MKKFITNNVHWFIVAAIVLAVVAIGMSSKSKDKNKSEKDEVKRW